jgi:hypothetical protein
VLLDIADVIAAVEPNPHHVDVAEVGDRERAGQNAAASGVYSGLARARSMPSARMVG